MDGDTLLNNINPPPHTMKYLVGKILVIENDTIFLLLIYHLQLLTQINNIAEALMGASVWVPISEFFPWVHVLDKFLAF